jgi:hypothetical protein
MVDSSRIDIGMSAYKYPRICAVAAALVGFIVLFGGWFDVLSLTHVVRGLPSR